MKIISPFKDYYDFVAYQYGVDEDIIYERPSRICLNTLIPDKQEREDIVNIIKHYGSHLGVDMVVKNVKYEFHRLILINRQIYYVKQTYPNKDPFYRLITDKDCYNLITLSRNLKRGPSYLQETKSSYIRNESIWFSRYGELTRIFEAWGNNQLHIPSYWDKTVIGDKIGVVSNSTDQILQLTKKLNIPVIGDIELIDDEWYITIPNLSKIQGISGMCVPHDLYRELVNFFINNRDSVDVKPPVEISNNDKITKAGFDNKSSFRGREFPKKPRSLKRS